MSPFTPFICEELLQYLPQNLALKISSFRDEALESEVNEILNVCQSIRQLKSNNKITKAHSPQIYIFPNNEKVFQTLSLLIDEIKSLTQANEVFIETTDISSTVSNNYTLFSSAGHLCSFG